MSNDTKKQNAELIETGLSQVTDYFDYYYYRDRLNRSLVYTPGIQFLIEKAGVYRLMNAIANWIGSPSFKKAAQLDGRINELHFWRLIVDLDNRTAQLIGRVDNGVKPFITHEIPFTNCPHGEIDVWARNDGQHWTLYLPSEH